MQLLDPSIFSRHTMQNRLVRIARRRLSESGPQHFAYSEYPLINAHDSLLKLL